MIKKNIRKLLIFQIISKYILRFRVNFKISRNMPINLIIGSGGIKYPDWISTDKSLLDITSNQEWSYYFKRESVDKILAEHLFEHLSTDDRNKALKNILFFLKPNGIIRIAVPDGYFPDPDYINQVKPGGYGPGADDHKFLYTYHSLGRILTDFGFNLSFLEYYDENMRFHYNEWNPNEGMIRRSVRFDERNQTGEIRYTSLIIDASKKQG